VKFGEKQFAMAEKVFFLLSKDLQLKLGSQEFLMKT